MRIVNRNEFLLMAPGTAYAKGGKWFFAGIQFKATPPIENDWFFFDPHWVSETSEEKADERLDEMLKHGVSYPMSNDLIRDGCFEANELFMIFESEDLERLQGLIREAIFASHLNLALRVET